MTESRSNGYDAWLDALADGDGYFLQSPAGYGWLPPRRVCPRSGSTDLEPEPLPDTGTVETYTVVHVPTPRFADDAPYVTAIASFGRVRLTGLLRGVSPDEDGGAVDTDVDEGAVDTDEDATDVDTAGGTDPAVGMAVSVGVESRATDGERVVVFRPA